MSAYTLDLCGGYYHELIQPAIDSLFGGLPYAAALLGAGSEVLGFDDEVSQDHDWSPRVILLLGEEDFTRHGMALQQALIEAIPAVYRGHQVDRRPVPNGRRYHHYCLETTTPSEYFGPYLNFDFSREIQPVDWLTFPEQKLLGITGGAVYHDGIGLQATRDRFAYYPRDVWLYLLLAGWDRTGQEEHLMGRAGSAGDEIGSAVIASRLVRDIMRLCFLMERQYAPYPKWFGTAFARLGCAHALMPILRRIQLAESWRDREEHFAVAWERVTAIHNDLGIDPPLQTSYAPFFTRAYRVCHAGDFCGTIRARITDPAVKRLASRGLFGGIDQLSDNTSILANSYWRYALRNLYDLASMESPPDHGRLGS